MTQLGLVPHRSINSAESAASGNAVKLFSAKAPRLSFNARRLTSKNFGPGQKVHLSFSVLEDFGGPPSRSYLTSKGRNPSAQGQHSAAAEAVSERKELLLFHASPVPISTQKDKMGPKNDIVIEFFVGPPASI